MLFCLIIIPRLDSVPDNANDVAKKATAEVLTSAGAVRIKLKNFLLKSLKVRKRYRRFSNETTIPIKLGASKKRGLNQNVSNFKIKG